MDLSFEFDFDLQFAEAEAERILTAYSFDNLHSIDG